MRKFILASLACLALSIPAFAQFSIGMSFGGGRHHHHHRPGWSVYGRFGYPRYPRYYAPVPYPYYVPAPVYVPQPVQVQPVQVQPVQVQSSGPRVIQQETVIQD